MAKGDGKPATGYPAPNYTQVPNILLEEHAPKMTEAELRVVLAIVRQTFGWHRRSWQISLTELCEMTGLSRQGVINGIDAGIERGIIARTPHGQGYVYELIISPETPVNEVDQNKSTGQRSRPAGKKTSQRSRPALVNEVDQLPPDLNKDLNKGIDLKKSACVSPSRDRDADAPSDPTPTLTRAVASANEESFDGPRRNGTQDKPAPRPRQPAVRSHAHFDPRKLVEGYIPTGEAATAVEVYYERFSPREFRLTAPLQDDIMKAVTDLERWRAAVTAWHANGHNPKSVGGMLDWYRDPSRLPSNRHRANGNGAAPTGALLDIKLPDWLLRTYHTNHLPSVIIKTDKSEKELRDEYKKWRVANGLPPG